MPLLQMKTAAPLTFVTLFPVLLVFVISKCSFCWHNFETPLEMAQPNQEGIYEFDLLVEHKFTMSTRGRDGRVQLADFNPKKAEWALRGTNGSQTFGEANHWPDLLQLDGLHRRVVAINGHSPGKTLVVPLGARVAMRVRNRLPGQALTIHLHGMHKRRAWWTDGVAFVQQCPIQPGQDFVYRFIADTLGTHWYHGHLMNDRADGLLGGFVVKKSKEKGEEEGEGEVVLIDDGSRRKERIRIGREYYSILQDWSSVPSAEQWLCQKHNTMKWLHGFDQQQAPAEADFSNDANHRCWAPKRTYDGSNVGGSVPLSAILVGEKGWHSQDMILRQPSKLPLTTFPIKKGENVLLRLVNGGISQGFMVWAEEHDLWILAADGSGVKPTKVDALILFPGERYDLLIHGLDAPGRRVYRLILETMEHINWDWTRMERPQLGLANLHYEDFLSADESEKDDNENVVDWKHAQCRADSKCRVLNCPFGQFPPQLNLTCLSADTLESAAPIEDQELLQQRHFSKDRFHEVFANMHADNHFDGWMFSQPRGIPYFHEGQIERVAQRCDPSKCDFEHSAHWDKGCECFVHFNFSLGSIVQITIYNMGDMANPHGPGYSHPLHVHGTYFLLLKTGYGTYHKGNGSIATMNGDIPCADANARCVGLDWHNSSWLGGNVPGMRGRPSWRDTVNIPVGGYITVRFRANNPGWWFAHCHLMLHNMGGTAFAFRVGTHQQVPKPPDNFPKSCGIYEEE